MTGWSAPGVVHLQQVHDDPVGRRVQARHRITHKPLTITYLSPELVADTAFRTRFRAEAARLTRVRDSRVGRVRRYVEHPHGAAVVSDRHPSSSLRAVLLAHGALGTEAALVVLKDVLRALRACHAAAVAHGDVKPEVVMVHPAGRVQLVDAGLWTFQGRHLLAQSTPFYLAPEQWGSRGATPAADVYAAMVAFFECIAGAPPYFATDLAELARKHESGTVPAEIVPAPVRDVVRAGLSPDPSVRPDASSLLSRIDGVASSLVGSGWERTGRLELSALIRQDAAAEAFAPARPRGLPLPQRAPLRLATLLGGALVLAAGLASPPLAVILPGGSLFGSDGRSPVLAFPESDHDGAPVHVVTNGPLADRASAPAAPKAAGLVEKVRPPADLPLSSGAAIRLEHLTPDALGGVINHSGVPAAHRPPGDHDASTPSACGPAAPAGQLCTAADPAPESGGTGSTPSGDRAQLSIPVSLSLPEQVNLPQLPVRLPVPLQLPAQVPVQLPAALPVQLPKPVPAVSKTKPEQSATTAENSAAAGVQKWSERQGKLGKPSVPYWAGNAGSSDHGGSWAASKGSGTAANIGKR
jgi:serine/threonine-protein kinase